MLVKRDDAAACCGLANANDKSTESNVGPGEFRSSLLDVGIVEDGCGDLGFAGWNLQIVTSFLNKGVLVDATASTDRHGVQVTSLM